VDGGCDAGEARRPRALRSLENLAEMRYPASTFFWSLSLKSSFLRICGVEIGTSPRKNPEPQGLTAKIFWNKELAADWEPLEEVMVENWVVSPSRI
jgi:hypothetical protein